LINRILVCISAILSGSNVHKEHANEISNIPKSRVPKPLSVEILNIVDEKRLKIEHTLFYVEDEKHRQQADKLMDG
jgi:hypothetical protein